MKRFLVWMAGVVRTVSAVAALTLGISAAGGVVFAADTGSVEPELALTLSPGTVSEGAGAEAVCATLTRRSGSDLSKALTVVPYTEATGKVVLPSTVVIPANVRSVRFKIGTVDNAALSGSSVVTIEAIVRDESCGCVVRPADVSQRISAPLTIVDDDGPSLSVAVEPRTVREGTEYAARLVVSRNFVSFSPMAVWLTHDGPTEILIPDCVTIPAGARSVETWVTTVNDEVEDGIRAVSIYAAAESGCSPGSTWLLVADQPNFQIVDVSCDKAVYTTGEEVVVRGRTVNGSGAGVAGAEVEVRLATDSLYRTLSAVSDANGEFSVVYLPASDECGHYTVSAGYPELGPAAEPTGFDLLGFNSDARERYDWDMTIGETVTNVITLVNPGTVPLTGIAAEAVGAPEGCRISFEAASVSLGPGASLRMKVVVAAVGPSVGRKGDRFSLRFTSAEGACLEIPARYVGLVDTCSLQAEPSAVSAAMTLGETRTVSFEIRNCGLGPTGEISVVLPQVDWLRAVGGRIPSLAAGETATVTLELSPSVSLDAGRRYSGALAVREANGPDLEVPLVFTAVTDGRGRLTVDAVDEYTYNTTAAPHLAGATVRITSAYTGETLAEGTSGEDGRFSVDEVPAGRWHVQVTADRHGGFQRTVEVEPGRETKVSAFLQFQAITATWVVRRTTVRDTYEVVLELDYETHVPAPVVKLDFLSKLPELAPGGGYLAHAVFENIGLIGAKDVSLTLPEFPGYSWNYSRNTFDLAAGASRSVPVMLVRDSGAPAGGEGEKEDPCRGLAVVKYRYTCNGDRWTAYGHNIDNLVCPSEQALPELSLDDDSDGDDGEDRAFNLDLGMDGGGVWNLSEGCSGSSGGAGGGEDQGVCAKVSLRLSQSVSMTREEFEGTLTLVNGHPAVAMTNCWLELEVKNDSGEDCNGLFEISPVSLDGFTGTSILAGDAELAAGATGSGVVRFVPAAAVAPTVPVVYHFGGNIHYVDPFTGAEVSMALYPVKLLVNPSAQLYLDYFVQRDVYADDPFTRDVVEASMPAELAVLVRNEGYGDASNVVIRSCQPEIVENEKGLQIDFRLSDYSLEGAALNGAPSGLGLEDVDLGTVAAHGSSVAQWWLTSTLQGHFFGVDASVTHLDSAGRVDTSLIREVRAHSLVRSVVADDDILPDFLTADGSPTGAPDRVYTSCGEELAVRNDIAGELTGAGNLRTVTASVPASGCFYTAVPAPGLEHHDVVRVTRGDGSALPLRNIWITDRTFIDGARPRTETVLHIFDVAAVAGERVYTVELTPGAADSPRVRELAGVEPDSLVAEQVGELEVVFTGAVDPASFTTDDVTVRYQGERLPSETVAAAVEIVPDQSDATRFTLVLGGEGFAGEGHYIVTVNAGGVTSPSGSPGRDGRSLAWSFFDQTDFVVADPTSFVIEEVFGQKSFTVGYASPVNVVAAEVADFRLTRDGMAVAIPGSARVEKRSDATWTLKGLDSAIAEEGRYRMTFRESAAVAWTEETQPPEETDDPVDPPGKRIDTTPPELLAITFDGREVPSVVSNGVGTVKFLFSEAVNVRALLSNGWISRAVRLERMDENGEVIETVAMPRRELRWIEAEHALVWARSVRDLPAGKLRFTLDSGLITDLRGNHLAAGGRAAGPGLAYFEKPEVLPLAHSGLVQAAPAWFDADGDGDAELVVGYLQGFSGIAKVYKGLVAVGSLGEPVAAGGCLGVSYADAATYGTYDGRVFRNGAQLWPTETAAEMASERAVLAKLGDALVVGGMDGRFRVLDADGNVSWLMTAEAPLEIAGGRSAAAFADWDGDGTVELVAGNSTGALAMYRQEGGVWLADALPLAASANTNTLYRSRPVAVDWDGDGVTDLLVGRADGEVEFRRGVRGANAAVSFEALPYLPLETALDNDGLVFEDSDGCWCGVATAESVDGVDAAIGFGPLLTAVVGPGNLCWWRRTDGGEWTAVTNEVSSGLRVVALNGSGYAELDQVVWQPSLPENPDERSAVESLRGDPAAREPAFAEFLETYSDTIVSIGEASAAEVISAAKSLTAKGTTLRDEFIAGTDPEDADDRFTAYIDLEGNDLYIYWEPDLNADAFRRRRVYRVYGTDSLLGDSVLWEEVPPGGETSHRFFKVTVGVE